MDSSLARAAHYHHSVLHIGGVAASALAAHYGTPLYVYDVNVMLAQYRALEANLRGLAPHVLICYALKANGNPALGGRLAALGAGADVVSGGELDLAVRMGFPPDRIVFAGVGKTRAEMAEALDLGIRGFHVESAAELTVLAEVAAARGRVAPVAVRVNPDIEAGTHPYITTGTTATKFGVAPDVALTLMREAADDPALQPVGLHAHIGSQLPRVQPLVDATARLLALWDRLAGEGIVLHELDIGGGLGIGYRPDEAPEGPEALARGLRPLLAGRSLDLLVEPGRFLAGPAGVLLTRVLYVKESTDEQGAAHTFVVVDAGMNDLLRPALYGAWHPIWPAFEVAGDSGPAVDVVGPVCESADVLGHDRRLGRPAAGDVLAIGQTGAYGYSMASQYNGRPRPAEVLVSGKGHQLIRRRETYADLWPALEPEGGPAAS